MEYTATKTDFFYDVYSGRGKKLKKSDIIQEYTEADFIMEYI